MTVGNQGMVLQISAAEVNDSGMYTCVAANEAGEVSKHFSLKVLGKSNLTHHQERLSQKACPCAVQSVYDKQV